MYCTLQHSAVRKSVFAPVSLVSRCRTLGVARQNLRAQAYAFTRHLAGNLGSSSWQELDLLEVETEPFGESLKRSVPSFAAIHGSLAIVPAVWLRDCIVPTSAERPETPPREDGILRTVTTLELLQLGSAAKPDDDDDDDLSDPLQTYFADDDEELDPTGYSYQETYVVVELPNEIKSGDAACFSTMKKMLQESVARNPDGFYQSIRGHMVIARVTMCVDDHLSLNKSALEKQLN
eukprot:TRINITY_DN1451_c0_g1_i1.p1 TRINITY_DN1451_c0_g1~~TRINITY_DN1451_c0_g1_i1.p1  ORF type:complete len:235 (+),score=33.42 TRINITY_DN1451_c0_g1_i1:2028-2732(+)